jgi:hypothetical protein
MFPCLLCCLSYIDLNANLTNQSGCLDAVNFY